MNFQLNPAKNKIYIPDIRITKLVPKSGWILTKFTIIKITINVINVFNKLIGSFLSYKYAAKKTGKVIFIISEDWRVKKPKSSHLFAPFASLPINRVSTIKTIDIPKNINELLL